MKNRLLLTPFLGIVLSVGICSGQFKSDRFIDYVDPFIGTAPSTTISAVSHGEGTELFANTNPAVGVPHGMTHFSPQTRASERKCLSPYYYGDSIIQGFRAGRWLNGSCTQDYGSVTLMPLSGPLSFVPTAEARGSLFSHQSEKASPACYAVNLDRYGIVAEMTGLLRSGIFRFTYQKGGEGHLVIQPNSDEAKGFVEIDTVAQEIRGYNPVHRIYQGSGKYAGFSGYFVIKLSKPFTNFGTFGDGTATANQNATLNQRESGGYVSFSMKGGEQLIVKVGTSFTSMDGARNNLTAEINQWDFEMVRTQSAAIWEKELSKIAVETKNNTDKIIFYTALYHNSLVPRIYNDVDGKYPEFSTGKIVTITDHNYYCEFSMWDIYRATLPMNTIINPSLTADWASSMVQKYKTGGWLPIFPLWNSYTSAMIGDHVTAFLGDLLLKGINNFDVETAYEAMRKNAFESSEVTNPEEYKDGVGRRALLSYLKYNYIPMEDSVWDAFHKQEQVSRTLEYAYDDFVLSQVAKLLNKPEYETLKSRSGNYKNMIDPGTNWARGRKADGSFISPFFPNLKVYFITEGTPMHYTWYVPHDQKGLINLMGGEANYLARLDSMFTEGYYWHGNEPGHQIPFLFNYAGAPWMTQKYTRKIMREEYATGPGGLCGNEDAGQMSAWYLFASAGFYPVCPGVPEYVIGSPIFDKITFHLENGRNFTVIARNNSDENCFIQSATLDGVPYNRSYIYHNDIINGRTLVLEMGSRPNKKWALTQDSRPYSMSR
nr:GH92 family glycosyl hydrolase [uncultured Macellibacteroides sp.]